MLRFIVTLSLFFLTAMPSWAQWHDWKSQHYRDHPLVGMVYLPSKKGPLDASVNGQLLRRQLISQWAAKVSFILLGENHDNPDHHLLQARMIDELAKAGRTPAVVFEMIPRNFAEEASNYDLVKDPELNGFAQRLEWEKRGWYTWEIYKPIALAAARNGLRMLPGNLDRTTIRELYKSKSALPDDQQKRFVLDEKFSLQHQKSLNEELLASHCGMIGGDALPAMSRIQRAKDGSMADALISTGLRNGAVLVAGNGHVRKDRGVPLVLRQRLPGFHETKIKRPDSAGELKDYIVRTPKANTFSIGLIEVQKNITDPKQYGLLNAESEPLYDVVIFTPKADITDPCAAMRKKIEPKKKSSND